VPLVPSPPGVWHAVSYVAAKTQQCRLKTMQVGELGIESSPMWSGNAPVGLGALIP